jgi:hypothetical protein
MKKSRKGSRRQWCAASGGVLLSLPAEAGDFYRAFRLGLRLDGVRLPPAPSKARG